AIVDRFGVGHRTDGSESASGCGARAGLNGFSMLKAGLAQMDVHVDESRRDDEAGGVEHLGVLRRKIRPDGGDAAFGNGEVGYGIVAGSRIDNTAVFDQQRLHARVPPSTRSS